MKTLYRHAFKLFAAFLLAFSLQGCVTNPGTWKNEQTSPGKRSDFHKLNDQLLKDLKVDDDKDLAFIESREMTDNVSTLRLVETLSNGVKQHDYELLDEYYAVNHFIGNDTIKNPVKGINTYHLVYGGLTHEMYFAFFAPKNKHVLNQDLITAVYAKYDYGWKISSLSINPYIINGKTAPELYRMAQDKYRNGQIVDALYTLDLTTQCGTPSEVWQYTNLEGMNNLYGQVTSEE